jgi:hypothetical protein
MAKLSAHGQEIGRIHYIRKSTAYFPDGKILCNRGDGWKLYKNVKPGIDPREAFRHCQESHWSLLQSKPALRAYHHAITAIPLSKRWKLTTAMEVLGDDLDGIWSETCDGYGDNLDLSVEEIHEMVSLRNAAISEGTTE